MEEFIKDFQIVPFTLTDDQLMESFTKYICSSDAPLDIALRSKVLSIRKIFYPVRHFEVSYNASWTASDPQYRTETSSTIETKTVFLDYRGQEHAIPGVDYFDERGNYRLTPQPDGHLIHWRPVKKAELVSKNRTVRDGSEEVFGFTGDKTTTETVIVGQSKEMTQWLKKLPLKNAVKLEGSVDSDCTVLPFEDSEQNIWEVVEKKVRSKARSSSKRGAAGCEDFTIVSFRCSYTVDHILLSVYELCYEYGGTEYKLWISGDGTSALIPDAQPKTDEVIQRKAAMESKYNRLNDTQWYPLFGSFATAAVALVGLVMLFFNPGVGVPLLVCGGAATPLLFLHFRKLQDQFSQLREDTKHIYSYFSKKRWEIAAIAKDPTLTLQQKEAAAKKILDSI